MAFLLRGVAFNLLLIVAMKLINQFTTFQYSVYNSSEYGMTNGSCDLLGPNQTNDRSPIMQVQRTGYLLAAGGGILANKFLGYRNALTLGGSVMTLAVGLMALSVWLRAICNLGLYVTVWLLHPVYMGIVITCLYFGFVRWCRGPASRTALIVLHYESAASTIWLNHILQHKVLQGKYNNSYGLLALTGFALSLAFTGLSRLLSGPHRWQSFQLPSLSRLRRYFIIIAGFVLYIAQLGDGHVTMYSGEILSYFNASASAEHRLLAVVKRSNLARMVNQAGAVATAAALLGLSAARRIHWAPPELRLQAGVGTAAAAAAVSFVASLAIDRGRGAEPSPELVTGVFCTTALLDGVAEILTMVAVYEFIDIISPRTHKLLLIGVMYSLWSIATAIRMLVSFVVNDAILPNIGHGPELRYKAIHATGFLLLIGCLIYIRCLSLPMSFTLQEQWQEVPVELPSEMQRLLPPPPPDQQPDWEADEQSVATPAGD